MSSLDGFEVFGEIPSGNEIFVPDDPFAIRNNCQIGQWNIGGTQDLGSKLSLRAIKFSRFFGNLGQTVNEMWGQLWFVAEPNCGSIPAGIVAVTYLKTRSLSNFVTLVNLVKSRNINPASGVFTATFVKQSRSLIDSSGNPSQGYYYYLSWDWNQDGSSYTDEQIILAIRSTLTKHDPIGTAQMINFDNLSSSDRASLLATRYSSRSLLGSVE